MTSSPSLSHWGILLCYFLEPPASIVIYTVKYAGCDLIPYIPVQIRAVSVQDYAGNSCNAASPQLISLWMSGESWVIHRRELPKLQCIIPSRFFISSTCLVCKRHDLGFSVLTACRVFIMGIRHQWLRCGAVFPLSSELLNANSIFVIIRQSSCSRSSNHHCHLLSPPQSCGVTKRK